MVNGMLCGPGRKQFGGPGPEAGLTSVCHVTTELQELPEPALGVRAPWAELHPGGTPVARHHLIVTRTILTEKAKGVWLLQLGQ